MCRSRHRNFRAWEVAEGHIFVSSLRDLERCPTYIKRLYRSPHQPVPPFQVVWFYLGWHYITGWISGFGCRFGPNFQIYVSDRCKRLIRLPYFVRDCNQLYWKRSWKYVRNLDWLKYLCDIQIVSDPDVHVSWKRGLERRITAETSHKFGSIAVCS